MQVATLVAVGEVEKDGYRYLQLKVPSKRSLPEKFWDFLEKYGYRYGGSHGDVLAKRPLLPCEVGSQCVCIYVFLIFCLFIMY